MENLGLNSVVYIVDTIRYKYYVYGIITIVITTYKRIYSLILTL